MDRDGSAQATASGSQLPLPEAAASLSSMGDSSGHHRMLSQPPHPTAHSQGQ